MSDLSHVEMVAMTEYHEGYSGYLFGATNPYQNNTTRWFVWLTGWLDAYDDEYSDHEEDEY